MTDPAMDALAEGGLLPDEDDQFIGIDQLFMGRPEAVKFDQVGDAVVGRIVDLQSQQARDFGTGNPKFYQDGRPVMEPVVIIQVEGAGSRTLYCGRGLRKAIGDAVRAVNFTRAPGQQVPGIRKGGYLHVTHTGVDTPRRPGAPGAKIYQASYVPPGSPPVRAAPAVPATPALAIDTDPPF
jgi:hypothetical protein